MRDELRKMLNHVTDFILESRQAGMPQSLSLKAVNRFSIINKKIKHFMSSGLDWHTSFLNVTVMCVC